MILSIYYRNQDKWLINKIDEICDTERKSRSAVILSILEEYFEREKKLGEILQDMGFVSLEQLQEALQSQKEQEKQKRLGQILVEKGLVNERHLARALGLQGKNGENT